MNITTFVVIANFFVKLHIMENNVHTYTLFGVQNDSINDSGIEYYITYVGDKLPVDDNKKFYARIVAECLNVSSPSEHAPEVISRSRICEAESISY